MEDSNLKITNFWQDLKLAWSFHSFFLPFLLPAGCLLLLTLAQANLLFASTVLGQQIIDTLSSHWRAANHAADGPMRILGLTLTTESPFVLAFAMALLLLLAAGLGIGTEQLRIGLSQRFRWHPGPGSTAGHPRHHRPGPEFAWPPPDEYFWPGHGA